MMASLLLWSLYLFLSVLSHATAQEIIQVSFEFEVEHVVINGNGAVARCTVTGYDSSLNTISSFIWKHNNTIIDLSSSTRHSESGSERTKRLDITSLMFNDAGSYSCIVEFVNLQQVSSTTDTLRIGTEITVEAESPQYAVAGQTGELRCTAQSSPSPSINWYRVESDTLLLQQFDSTASDFGVYRISNVQTDDAGLYKCRGSYSFGSEEKEIQLIVLNRPTVTGTQFDETVMVGATFNLSCTVNDDATTAVHRLNHSWTFTPHDSTESARLTGTRYSIDATSGSLTVTGASYDDAGVYSCEVSNAAGNDTQNNMVSIEGAPFITLETGLITQGVSSTASKVYLDCPFIGNPSPTVAWYDGERLIAEDSKYRIHENGTLEISDYDVLDTVTYRCEVNNEHGMDDRNYDFQLWEISSEPSNLVLTIDPNDDRTVTLTWNAPTEMSGSILFNSAEFYVVEQSINNEEYAQVETVPSTSVTLSELLPGETHTFRVMAGNIAGLSTPSVTVTHTPAPREPSLSLFQVTPLLDGRSMLVSWELEFDGGSDITSFSIQVLLNGDPFIILSVDVSDGELTIVNLDPDTEYTVSALLINAVGPTTAQETLATLPALPSPPSLLTVTHSSGYHTISFSIKKGSSPITHFIINYTQSAVLTSPEQLVIASNDSNSVISMEGNGTSGVDTEHSVVLKLAGLEKSAEVRVAGRSELGDGPFSEVGMIESKEHVIYVIIAAVVGGMLLVVTVILTAVIIAVCRKKCNRGRKIAITARGIRPSSLDLENGIDSFALKSPPNGRRAGSFVRSPPLTPSTTREGISSPLYSNSLSSSVTKLNTQNSVSGSNLDTVVDMHNDSLTIKISDFHSSSKSIPHNYSPPEGNNRQHLCLQTSLSGDRNDVRSVVSENHLLVIPNNSNDSTLSKSTPMMNRLSCDSVLDTMPTSYMTDV